MKRVRVIALGNSMAGDDGAALAAVARLGEDEAGIVRAGRPGVGLIDLLDGDRPTVLVDVTRSGAPAGSVLRLPLREVPDAVRADPQTSSHGFGPAEALRLARVLGRRMPPGEFVGIEGERYGPGGELSLAVAAAMEVFVVEVRAALGRVGRTTR